MNPALDWILTSLLFLWPAVGALWLAISLVRLCVQPSSRGCWLHHTLPPVLLMSGFIIANIFGQLYEQNHRIDAFDPPPPLITLSMTLLTAILPPILATIAQFQTRIPDHQRLG